MNHSLFNFLFSLSFPKKRISASLFKYKIQSILKLNLKPTINKLIKMEFYVLNRKYRNQLEKRKVLYYS